MFTWRTDLTRRFRLAGAIKAADPDHPAPELFQPWLAESAKDELLGLLVDPVPEAHRSAWHATFTLLWAQAAVSKVFSVDAVAIAAGIPPHSAPALVAAELQGLRLDELVEAATRIDGVLVPCSPLTHRGIEFLFSARPLDYPIVVFRSNAEGAWPEIYSAVA
jgi:hypothetical protein